MDRHDYRKEFRKWSDLLLLLAECRMLCHFRADILRACNLYRIKGCQAWALRVARETLFEVGRDIERTGQMYERHVAVYDELTRRINYWADLQDRYHPNSMLRPRFRVTHRTQPSG